MFAVSAGRSAPVPSVLFDDAVVHAQPVPDAAHRVVRRERAIVGEPSEIADQAQQVRLAARQQAYAGYIEIHDDRSAARCAWRLFWDHLYNGDEVVALGWSRRARRHVVSIPEGSEHGYLALADSELALNRGSVADAEAHAAHAVEIGERHQQQSIVAFGLTLHGRALIAQGRIEQGCASMDEAMTLVLGGRLDVFFTGAVYCTVVAECRDVADMRRAAEWTDAAGVWCASLPVVTPYHGICRIHRGEVLGLRGAWQ